MTINLLVVDSASKVCEAVEELNEIYKKVKIISITAGTTSFYIFYELGEKKWTKKF